MTETAYRLRLQPFKGIRPKFIDATKNTYDGLLEQAKAEGTFRVYVVKTIFNKPQGNFTSLKTIQKYLHPDWPFITQAQEDRAWNKLKKLNQEDSFTHIYGYEHNTRDYSHITFAQ